MIANGTGPAIRVVAPAHAVVVRGRDGAWCFRRSCKLMAHLRTPSSAGVLGTNRRAGDGPCHPWDTGRSLSIPLLSRTFDARDPDGSLGRAHGTPGLCRGGDTGSGRLRPHEDHTDDELGHGPGSHRLCLGQRHHRSQLGGEAAGRGPGGCIWAGARTGVGRGTVCASTTAHRETRRRPRAPDGCGPSTGCSRPARAPGWWP